MKELNIDLETRSAVDIGKTGVYRYAEDESFDILLFGVSVDGGEVEVYDLASGESIPEEILLGITDPAVTKHAYNAAFERICLSEWLWQERPELLDGRRYLDPISWECTMIRAAYNGLPFSLAQVGEALKLPQQKMTEGRNLIREFCVPLKKTDEEGTQESLFASTPPQSYSGPARRVFFRLPEEDPERWVLFKEYNRRDVETELAILNRLRTSPVPERIWTEYRQDQAINDRGIGIDRELVEHAIEMDSISRAELTERMKKLTGLENPNSVSQLKTWLAAQGLEVETLGKKDISSMLKGSTGTVRKVLSLRLQSAKSSVRKYEAMKNAVCRDGRCRGMFQFYGASRSGRWAGRLIQLQNLPQNHLEDLAEARALVKSGDREMLELLYGPAPQVLSELIRTAFVPAVGNKFIVADFSAIEARVLAHLAGEKWREKVFQSGGDIYCASASQMFRVPVEKHGVNGHLRQKGKIAELALGYGGGVGALKSMGALEMGLDESELQPLVSMWRDANPKIVEYWQRIDSAAKHVIQYRRPGRVGSLRFQMAGSTMKIQLPSGRELNYMESELCENRFGGVGISYLGLTAQKKWDRIESYGPKLVENITQAVSRDLLAEAMQRLKGCSIVGHVHDEVIIEAGDGDHLEDICRIMAEPPEWMPDICLRADGYECEWYRKE